MGNTYEAMQRAERDFLLLKKPTAVEADEKYGLSPAAKAAAAAPTNGWLELHNRLLSHYPQKPLRTLMVTGINHGVGVTSTVIKFARALTRGTGRNALLIDANLRTPDLHLQFDINPDQGMAELMKNNGLVKFKFKKVLDEKLYAFTCGKRGSVGQFEARRFEALMEAAREHFDYTILDSAPITGCSESQAICSRVDGVLLVIEAGKTRRQVAMRAKKELEDAGGRLLGVVLNRRKYYIPEWIYKRL